jgi:hypothetical protein
VPNLHPNQASCPTAGQTEASRSVAITLISATTIPNKIDLSGILQIDDIKAVDARQIRTASRPLPASRADLIKIKEANGFAWKMDLISLVITLIVVGVLLWLVNNYIPMDGQIKRLLNGVVVIATVIWLLNTFGILNSIRGVHVGR